MLLYGAIFVSLIVIINPSFFSVFFGLVFILLLWLGAREKNLLNPYNLFASTPLTIIIYNKEISTYFLKPLNAEVGIVMFLGIGFFILGLLAVKRKKLVIDNGVVNRHFWVIFIVGLTPHLLGTIIAGLPIFNQGNVALTRESYSLPIISQFSIFLPISIIVAFQQKSTLKILLSISVTLFFSFAILAKFSILLALMFILFGLLKYGHQSRIASVIKLTIIPVVLLIPMLFSFIFDARSEFEQSDYQWRQNISTDVPILEQYGDFIYLPYLYLTTPWSNLAHNVEINDSYDYGLRTVKPLISLLQLDGFVEYEPKPIYQYPMNTYSFITDFYLDAGGVGVIILSFILGLFVKKAYLFGTYEKDSLKDGLWVTVGFATFMMFFSNHFTSVGYPLVTLVLIMFYQFACRIFKNINANIR
ncbi:O-antigen polymerase [Thalassotalea sp. ND16A]|uniref:O-antigen polymerase n=1 Tax=Thalassotalea sp. ND16A TaxID=1535422 RepID=UPI00051A43CB|nr:O-antigen polymerase [Thalassotalea sp. ND16A]KGJ94223.1 hypothetical protein ND16A_1429 [Thalassotalea sp. ND16A]